MPTYQYACTNPECGNRFELVQSFTDPSATECPVCGSPVRKVYGSVGVVFKGSGFYRNDSRSGDGKSDAGSSAKSDSKSETKSETTSDTSSSAKTDSSAKPAKSDSSSSASSSTSSPSSSKSSAPA